jgi:hypothetical protein
VRVRQIARGQSAPVEHHDVAADARHHLAAYLDVAQQAGGGALGSFEDQGEQLVAHLRAVAHAADIEVLLRHTARGAIAVPERNDLGGARFVHRATMSENRQTDNAPRP